jgi:hypothetical protein
MTNRTWTVQLNATFVPYTHVDLKRSRDHVDGYKVVMVNLDRLITCFERNHFVIPPVSAWGAEKRDGLQAFLNPSGGACEMPLVSCERKEIKHRRLFGLMTPRVEEVLEVSFTNGRHRTRYLQFAGATVIPVEVHKSQAAQLQKYCGAI